MNEAPEFSDRQFQLFFGCILSAAAVFVFFSTPLLNFADTTMLCFAGVLFAFGIFFLSWMMVDRKKERWSLAFLIGGLMQTGFTLIVATARHDANEKRCEDIQADMLSAAPKRPDSADLFQALNCVPITTGNVAFPKKAHVPVAPRTPDR